MAARIFPVAFGIYSANAVKGMNVTVRTHSTNIINIFFNGFFLIAHFPFSKQKAPHFCEVLIILLSYILSPIYVGSIIFIGVFAEDYTIGHG